MFKLIKYEIRGAYKFVSATILLVAIAMAAMQYSIYKLDNAFVGESAGTNLVVFQLLLPLLIIIMMAAGIAFIVYLIQSFRKELYEDRGYLTFTLPLNGSQILAAKFLTAIFWTLVFGIVLIGINAFVFSMLFDSFIIEQMSYQFRILFKEIGRGVMAGGFIYIVVSSLASLLIVYFSISLSKVAIKNRRIGGLWIIIFIFLQAIFDFIEIKLVNLFPVFRSLGQGPLSSNHNLTVTEFGLAIDVMTGSPVFSVTSIIYWIVLGIGMFLLTSYLLDRKIEL